MKFYSEKLQKVFDTAEACQKAEFEAKEAENREKIRRERELAAQKEQQEEVAAERKAMAERVETARKEMVAAQHKYSEVMNQFIERYGSYHFTSTSLEDIPVLFSALNPFNFFK